MCSAAGWGNHQYPNGISSIRPLQIDIPRSTDTLCSELYGIENLMDQFCAGGNSSETCHGDSGGPVVCKVGESWKLTGIVSHGKPCGIVGKPTAYVRVASYYSWITFFMNK